MKKIFLTLIAFLFVSGCKTNPYELDDAVYQYKIRNTPISISFNAKEQRFSGKVVNNYFGTYEQSGENITLHPLGATMMMGPNDAMQAEQEWLQLLINVKAIKQQNDHILFIMNNNQTILLTK